MVVRVPVGAVVCPLLPLPQQVAVPSVRSPQVWKPPAVRVVKLPVGALVCPPLLSPQQVAVPSMRSPQVWR